MLCYQCRSLWRETSYVRKSLIEILFFFALVSTLWITHEGKWGEKIFEIQRLFTKNQSLDELGKRIASKKFTGEVSLTDEVVLRGSIFNDFSVESTFDSSKKSTKLTIIYGWPDRFLQNRYKIDDINITSTGIASKHLVNQTDTFDIFLLEFIKDQDDVFDSPPLVDLTQGTLDSQRKTSNLEGRKRFLQQFLQYYYLPALERQMANDSSFDE